MMNCVVRGAGEFVEENVDALIVRREVRTTMERIDGVWMGRALRYGEFVIHAYRVYVASLRTDRTILTVYRFLDSRREIDSDIELAWICGYSFEDEGHAVAAGIAWCDEN